MSTELSEDTKLTLDLKTIGIIVFGVLSLASMWFTKVRNIKTPDKWMHYFIHNYPGIKPLKKKGNNLIQTILKEEGIYSEKTCAFSFATLEKLVKSGIIKKNEKIIIPITGSGLKEST